MTTFDVTNLLSFADYFEQRYGESPDDIVLKAQKDYVLQRIGETESLDSIESANMIRAVRETENAVLFLLPYALSCTFAKVAKYFVNYDNPGDFKDVFFIYNQDHEENTVLVK